MYGYVRPVKGELKVSEYERYRGVYCGLCHELSRRCGFLARFLVNYDFTFLAMLLAGDERQQSCPRRCAAHPIRKTQCLCHTESLAAAADMTVILGWWKLADGGEDKRPPLCWGYKLACLLLKRAYKKAAGRQPDFARAVKADLEALRRLERENCPSLDEAADKFALILRAIGQGLPEGAGRRVAEELLYHLGRIIYILDAADDLPEDEKSGAYNPLRFRFRPENGRLTAEDEKTLRAGLQLSHNALAGAYALMEENPYGPILSNIIYLGLPAVTQAIFAGTWKAPAKYHRERRSI